MRNYIKIANKYIENVLSNKIPTCRYVKQACQRQVKDLKKKSWAYHFDTTLACRVCKFIEALTHVKGPKAGENIKLEPWQIFILTTVFGWVDKNNLRRFQRVYIEVPRGNGKSALSSGVGLYMLCADNEKGADVYSFATTRDQAKIVFGDAQAMARANQPLKDCFGLNVLSKTMVVPGTNSKFEAKSADGSTLDGLNTHCGIIDELHAHRTREVYDVVETSIGKRSQPILWCITTAGFNLIGICMEVRRFVCKILDGSATEESQFGIIYTIDDGDDWKTEDALIKANPNWNISVQPKVVLANLSKALSDPAAENNYKTKHLCVWCNADSAFFQMSKWRECYRPEMTLEDFEGEYCIYGLDLAAKTDITALVRLFFRKEKDEKVHYYVFPEFWLPEDKIQSSANSQYKSWAKQDLIHTTDGAINDLESIQNYIAQDSQRFDTLAIAFDPWQAYQLASNLMNDGIQMVELKPTVANFSEPMKEVQALCYQKRLHTDGNPVLEWMASNLVAHMDAKDNVYPRKETPDNKIDGMVALIMAMKQALLLDVENGYSDGHTFNDEPLIF
jgi:phage terminase large subunit-like protein